MEGSEGLLRRCKAGELTVRSVSRGNSVAIFVKDFDGNQLEIKGPLMKVLRVASLKRRG